jgi:hypothetical protein
MLTSASGMCELGYQREPEQMTAYVSRLTTDGLLDEAISRGISRKNGQAAREFSDKVRQRHDERGVPLLD